MQWKGLFKRHFRITIVLINLFFVFIMIGSLEIIARYYVSYDIGYYTQIRRTSGEIDYPYGRIPVNSVGGFDEEFNLQSGKRRVGYFGDSVIFGLGAGYPYRISEVVEKAFPSLEHWNLSFGIGAPLDAEEMVERARDLKLDLAIYVMNLNDISPTVRQTEDRDVGEIAVGWMANIEKTFVEPLRDKSYVYNVFRTGVKNALQRLGYQESGSAAIEFWPSKNEAVLREFSREILTLAQTLNSLGTEFCVLLLPYEMQISSEAERVYADLGFSWEEGFERGLTQERLMPFLKGISVYDARRAFDRETARIGEYYVYNKGDKIDWNHPNRAGHARIAKGFIESGVCKPLSAFEEESHSSGSPGSLNGAG